MNEKFDGFQVRKLRREKGLSQKQLAEMINISNSYLCDIEVGRTNPSVATLLKIADILKVDISAFVSKKKGD